MRDLDTNNRQKHGQKQARPIDAMAKLLELERNFGAEAVAEAVGMWMRARRTNVWRFRVCGSGKEMRRGD